VLALADHGAAGAVAADAGLRLGVNVAGGVATQPAVARSIGQEPVAIETALGAA
jgi:alanine dehydrogenase